MLAPDLRVRLLPASMDTFLPEILISPFGALMLIPEKALTDTEPHDELILTERLSVEALMLQIPNLSPISTPPSKDLLVSLSPNQSP